MKEILATAERHFETLRTWIPAAKFKGKLGVYFGVADYSGTLILIHPVGNVEEQEKDRQSVFEQIERLSTELKRNTHQTSRQSRDGYRDKRAGAVLGRNYIFACAGLSEDICEFFSVLVAVATDSLPVAQAEQDLLENDLYMRTKTLPRGQHLRDLLVQVVP